MIKKYSILFVILLIHILVTACTFQEQTLKTQMPVQENLVAETLTPIPTPKIFKTPTVQLPQDVPVRIAWFYKPPSDGNLSLVAKEFNFFIMSKGNEPERDQLLKLGAKKPILQYVRFEAIMDPGPCNRKPLNNNVAFQAGDFCQISMQHPDWFLLDRKGKRIVDAEGTEDFVYMDPGNPGWRAFFLERLRQTQMADKNWGGVFLDNVELTTGQHEDDHGNPNLANYPDEASYQAAIQGFLQYLYANYFKPNSRLLFANLIARKNEVEWNNYLPYLDGVMQEGWSLDSKDHYRPAAVWEKQMNNAEQAQSSGKFTVLVAQGERKDLDLQKFAFVSYLLINQGRAAFRYANSGQYTEAWLYDNYKLDLGKALGPRFKDGDSWRRNFQNGSVLVNPETHEVQINIKN